MQPNVRVVNTNNAMDLNTADAVRAMAVSDSAVPVAGFHAQTKACHVNVAGADVRATFDGTTTPVGGSVGALLTNGFFQTFPAAMVARMQFIRNASTDAVVNIIPVK